MLYLPTPTPKELNAYFGSIEGKLTAKLKDSSIDDIMKNYLNSVKLKEIITDIPERLIAHHTDIMSRLIPAFDEAEFNVYIGLKRKKSPRTPAENIIFHKYEVSEYLFKIFDYDKIIVKDKGKAYALAKALNRNTCTYCNRLYTITVTTTKKGNNITRPQFDHWLAKSRYPLLALSYYNLIPSCSVCNSSVKGDIVFSRQTHIHPYEIANKEDFTFTYYHKSTTEIAVDITFHGNRIKKTIEDLKIKEIYDAHSHLELKDLYDLRYKYSEDYLDNLLKMFNKLGVSKQEAYRLAFGVEQEEDDFHKRPFSKFKKDILGQLGVKL